MEAAFKKLAANLARISKLDNEAEKKQLNVYDKVFDGDFNTDDLDAVIKFLPDEEEEFELAMKDVCIKYRDDPIMDNNIFYKLAYERNINKDGNSNKKCKDRPFEVCHIPGKREVRYRQYELDVDEVRLFLKYYNVPVIEINNVKVKVSQLLFVPDGLYYITAIMRVPLNDYLP
jgi:hypothetical protein